MQENNPLLDEQGRKLLIASHRKLMREASRYPKDPDITATAILSDNMFRHYEQHSQMLCLLLQGAKQNAGD